MMTRKAPHFLSGRPFSSNMPSISSLPSSTLSSATFVSTMASQSEADEATADCLTDLSLPPVPFPDTCNPLDDKDEALLTSAGTISDPELLAAGVSNGCSDQAIQAYLQRYSSNDIENGIDNPINDFLSLTYAINSNSAQCVELLLENGASLDCRDASGIPPLARAVMQTKYSLADSTEVVKVLLAYGADPFCIPEDMWMQYIDQPSIKSPDNAINSHAATWCEHRHRVVLAETLHLTHRYLLRRASLMSKTKAREKQVITAHNILHLPNLPLMLVGQTHATKLVADTLKAEIILPTLRPLLLAFTGPSGHGKTELATQMGRLLNLPSIEIDCAQTRQEFALLGAAVGFESNPYGSPLNNFLVDNAGQRCVIFLDEFDKTTKEVREALLKVTDNGMYRDRRPNGGLIDASQAIWIMASNLGDTAIEEFYHDYLLNTKEENIGQVSLAPLREQIETLFREAYTPAVTSRIDEIIPFFPFSPSEAAVVAHKFLLSLQNQLRLPIDLEHWEKRYVAHSHLHIVNDGRVCQHLAAQGYVEAQGARSLMNEVGKVRRKVVGRYLDSEEVVDEKMNEGPLGRWVVQLQPVGNGMGDEVVVSAGGVSEVKKIIGKE